MDYQSLEPFFRPRSVAVVGATDRDHAVGRTVVENLKACRQTMKSAQFEIYPINPKRPHVCDLPCFKGVSECPVQPVDLAVIVVPAKSVKGVVIECCEAKVKGLIVISAGFKELGTEGAALEDEIVAIVREAGVRLVGPNCLGIMCPHWGLNASFAADSATKGGVAFISQSGAMCSAVLDWSLQQNLGFSAFVSIGSMADVDWGDLLAYLEHDDSTSAVMIYMETMGCNVGRFLKAAVSITKTKPVFVIKAGQTNAAAKAAASHTGSLAGSHDAFLAAMKRAGVIIVHGIHELQDMAYVLGLQRVPREGNRLLIITNAGGPGVLATDAAALSGASIADLSEEAIQKLNKILPAEWSHANPIDVLGDASADLYGQAMRIALAEKDAEGVLVVLSPQAMTKSTEAAQKVVQIWQEVQQKGESHEKAKTVLGAWMGGLEVKEGSDFLAKNGIPSFPFPDSAASIFGKICTHFQEIKRVAKVQQEQQLNKRLQDLAVKYTISAEGVQKARDLILSIRDSGDGRSILTEDESKTVLRYFGVPIAETVVCHSAEEAAIASNNVGFPCVVKLHSEIISHKSDVGGVKLNLKNAEEVHESYSQIQSNVKRLGVTTEAKEKGFQGVTVQPMIKLDDGIELILGSVVDQQLGPLVLYGMGGCMVEILKDTALGIPPLDHSTARLLIEDTKIYKALKGGEHANERFKGCDLDLLTVTLCNFSQMICALTDLVSECDINPLLGMKDKVVALDARIVVKRKEGAYPQPALA